MSIERETPPFQGGDFSKDPRARLNLFRKVAYEENPIAGLIGPKLLRQGGARDKKTSSIEPTSGKVAIIDRGFWIIAEHNMAVAFTANEIAKLAGLDDRVRDIVVAGALVHDAIKPVEIALNSYRPFRQNPEITPSEAMAAEDVIRGKIQRLGLEDQISLDEINAAVQSSMFDYLNMMEGVNKAFFASKLAQFDLSPYQYDMLLELTTADGFANLDRLVIRVKRLTSGVEGEDIDKLKAYSDSIAEHLPEVPDDDLDLPVAIIWASDYMVSGTKLQESVDARIAKIVGKNEYDELDMDWKIRTGGELTQFEATKLAVHAIEQFVRQRAVADGKLDAADTRTIPQIVLDRLQKYACGEF